jgi:prolyl-tRNA synthetase
MAERITPRNEDFAQWYSDIITHAKLADYSPVRGCMVLRPNGYAIWEVMQRWLDRRFKETGHQNAYFPLFIPMSFLQKEKDHVEGFAPQLAVVTHGGGKELEEPLVVRPTSETIINAMYSKWIKSYRDLPVLINQWANVVRWELRTKPFLRTLEFLWQEGHTCHETEAEAKKETVQMLGVYQEFLEKVFAIPVIAGEKTASEKFAGAVQTLCLEAMMQDKKALQATTSHFFGTKFAEVFDIKFQDRNGQQQYVHQTSWGATTRLVGALIMTHSDDQGLVLPPSAAPVQIVIIPIIQKNKDNSEVLKVAAGLRDALRDRYSVQLDDREGQSAGYKFNEWEIQGIPLRIEVGPRDLAENICVFARRDGVKTRVKIDQAVAEVPAVLDQFQKALFDKAKAFLDSNTFEENDYATFQKRIEDEPGFYRMHWCGDAACEAQIKEETKATIRCIPFDRKKESGKCVKCGKPSPEGRVIFARNY